MSAVCHGIPDETCRDMAVKAKDLYEEWEAEFKPLLGHTARWEGFCYIVRDQLAREWVSIVETGTLRQVGGWDGDGCSTKIWDWLVKHRYDGKTRAFSVDADAKAVATAKAECENVYVYHDDSVKFLRGHLAGTTLLYLDSCDYPEDLTTRINSIMHQAAELASAWSRLPSGCLIASDDSFDENNGKPAMTRRVLSALGIQPIIDSYIVIWRKP